MDAKWYKTVQFMITLPSGKESTLNTQPLVFYAAPAVGSIGRGREGRPSEAVRPQQQPQTPFFDATKPAPVPDSQGGSFKTE
jgi:hypothetical protein